MLLAAALGVERSLAVAHLEALFDAHLIRECDTGYRFEQPLLCEALYQGMSTHRRASIELCVAQARELLRKGGSNGLYTPLPVGDSPPERRC